MALREFTKDMDIILKLDDEPNDVGGLSANELKAKFDEGGKAVKDYLNNELVPHIKDMGEGHTIQDSEGNAMPERKVLRFKNARVTYTNEYIEVDGDSKSAYESAQEGGYVGTESAFNRELAQVGNKADVTLVSEITISPNKWTKRGNDYVQTVSVPRGNSSHIVFLQPTSEQIYNLANDGVLALMVNNDNGVFTAVAVDAAPTSEMTIQATLMEVSE